MGFEAGGFRAGRWARRVLPLAGLALLSACGGGGAWNGQRGYGGTGDYGYNLPAERAAARNFRAQAAQNYPPPGTADDPWGPYIREAAGRYSIPDVWIRAIMRRESGGHLYMANGELTTSGVGAMGLMQVMPQTYEMLRQRYGLGEDPYDPRNNIMAGAGYIREMYDQFGAPGFVAAYNAGPQRLAAYLAGSQILPDETMNYLALVAPQLGSQIAMTGPLAVYAGGASGGGSALLASAGQAYDPNTAYQGGGADPNTAYQGGGANPNSAYQGGGLVAGPAADGSGRAFDGGGLVTSLAPRGNLTGRPVVLAAAAAVPAQISAPIATSALYQPPAYQPPAPAQPSVPAYHSPAFAPPSYQRADYAVSPAPTRGGEWAVQVGAFPDPEISRAAIARAQSHAGGLLAGATPAIIAVQHDGTLFRARLVGLSGSVASLVCATLARDGVPCFAVPPGS